MPRSVSGQLLAARARHAGARWLLVALAVALATVLPVITAAVTRTTASAALHRGVAQLPAGERALTVSYTGLSGPADLARLDPVAGARLADLGAGTVRRELLFGALVDTSGRAFRLAGSDRLPGTVRLLQGRLPTSCTPVRCEVVLLTRGTAPAPTLDPGLGLVVVGRVARTEPLLLSGTFDPGADAPVLLADGAGRIAALASLSAFGRAIGWVAPLDLDRVVRLGVDAWVHAAALAATALDAAAPGLVLTAPETVLRDQDARARLSAQRFGLLGGATAVVLLGSAVVGGAALRRDHEAFTGALRRRGASRRLLAGLLLGESALATGAGLAVGLLVGGACASALAARAGLPAAGTGVDAVLAALPSVLWLGLVAAGLLVAALAVPARAAGPRGGGLWRSLEAGAAGCLAVAALLAARGGVGASAAVATDPLLPALPVLVLTAAALLMARVWPGLTRAAVRAVPRRAVGARIGLSAAGGRPLRPAATAAVLTAAVAAAVFAGSYAATLDRGASDQAGYAVPLDLRLLAGPGAPPPLQAVPPQQLATALPGAAVHAVVRTTGSIRQASAAGDSVQFVGVDPPVLPVIPRWGALTGGGADPGTLAAALAIPAAAPAGDPGADPTGALPAGALLRIPTSGGPVRIAVSAVLRAPDGREGTTPLAVEAGALIGRLPELRDAHGVPARLRLVAVKLQLPTDEAARRLHALGEGSHDQPVPVGSFTLGAPSLDGATLPAAWAGWSAAAAASSAGISATTSPDGSALALTYQLPTGIGVLVAPAEALGGAGVAGRSAPAPVVLPVAVDPTTAADAAGGLTLLLDGVPFGARVVAVLDRFPTTAGRFALLDRRALADLIDRTQPGTASPAELWLNRPDRPDRAAGAAIDPGMLGSVQALDRAGIERSLRTDPVARAATGLLLAGAGFSLAVALVALVLLVAAERTDEAAASYAWEADGVAPGTLRAGLWWRAAAVAGPAVPVGVAVGVLLSGLAGRLVSITATATTPVPPLQPAAGAGWGLVAVVAGLAAALLLAAGVAGRSLREPLPVRRAGWSGWSG